MTMTDMLIRLKPPKVEDDVHIPVYPRRFFDEKPEWFDERSQKIHIEPKTGRAAGYFVQWGSCLLNGNDDECWQAPRSPTDYRIFHQGNYVTSEDETIPVGVIGGGGDHAPVTASNDDAWQYYADVDKQLMVGQIHEDDHGAYFLGAVLPDVSRSGIDRINRSALSGDWRWYGDIGSYDCLGPWLVTRPGFPLDRSGHSQVDARSGFVKAASVGRAAIYLSAPVGVVVSEPRIERQASMGAPATIQYQGELYQRRRVKQAQVENLDPDVVEVTATSHENGDGDEEGGDMETRVADLETRVADLEAMVLGMGNEAVVANEVPLV